jgi:Protein of unknown function (DUF1064)
LTKEAVEKLAAFVKATKSARNKFKVVPKERRTWKGVVFASEREMNRWITLERQQDAGIISHLEYQPKFIVYVKDKKLCTYTADSSYYEGMEESRVFVVEDVKSRGKGGTGSSASYKLRRKGAELMYGFQVREYVAR